jgi:hypothetical protein
MTVDTLEINVAMQIQKPVNEVFEAIINPEKMSHYFISKSTGIMEEDKSLIWNFPEFDFDCPNSGWKNRKRQLHFLLLENG